MLVEDDMDNWMANRMYDVDSLNVEIENLNNHLVRFCFIRDIDSTTNCPTGSDCLTSKIIESDGHTRHGRLPLAPESKNVSHVVARCWIISSSSINS
jgi:hypothetical protein